jgi:ligand-binding SRPBCC domain-containing protein
MSIVKSQMSNDMHFVKETVIHASPERLFAFHELPDAFSRLMPPWENSRIIEAAPSLHPGARAIVETKILGLFNARWVSVHTAYDPPHMFEDVQTSGPFRSWTHRHIVTPHQDGAVLRDEIEYVPPLGFLGRLAAPLVVVPRLRKLFNYRHDVTRTWCERTGDR